MPDENIKTISIDFFTPTMARNSNFDLGAYLLGLEQSTHGPLWQDGTFLYEVRGVEIEGDVVKAVFAKIRRDQLPHLGAPGGQEREIDGLEERDGVIEKNHFIYRRGDDLLVWQSNMHGCHIARMARYLTQQAGETVTFSPLVQQGALERLMRDRAVPVGLEVSFARPTNPEMYPATEFNTQIMELMNGLGGNTVKLHISSQKNAVDPTRKGLTDKAKRVLSDLSRMVGTRNAKMKVMEDGVEHMIDLVADRIRSKQNVNMAGRYPIKGSMYAALNDAFNEEREAIYAVIGSPEHRL